MPAALWALAIGAFGIGMTEFVIAGLLPQIALQFNVTIPTAGYLATLYALGVFIGAPLVTILVRHVPRKTMLIALASIFTLGNLITALAPNFEVALAGRIITSLNHGAFFGMGSVIAAGLVTPNKRARAIAFMFSGLTLANLAGVPFGTWLAQETSWRVTFFAISLIGIATIVSIMTLMPHIPAPKNVQVRKEMAAFSNPRVLLAMAITVLGPAAFFTSITYMAPMMLHIAHYSEGSIVWLMMLFGLGLAVGNMLGGRYADRALMPTLYITLTAQAVVLLIFWLAADNQIIAASSIFLMAVFGFATVSPIQKLVMDKAQAAGAPTLAASVNIGMFNLGNALGAWLGGLVITLGFGYAAPNWAGAVLSLSALALAIIAGLLDRRETFQLSRA